MQESVPEIELKTEDNTDYDADDEETGITCNSNIIVWICKWINQILLKFVLGKTDANLMPPPPPIKTEAKEEPEVKVKRQLNTPLAAMLPSKYAHVDVTELFPDFRYDKVNSFYM